MNIGIDIGGTNIKALITDDSGKILEKIKTPTGTDRDEIMKNIFSVIDSLTSKTGTGLDQIPPIGVGVPGSVDSKQGHITMCPNIRAFHNYNLADAITSYTKKKSYIINDATAALYGEWWLGKGAEYSNWIMLTLGTGIGGGAIVDNRPLLGRDGYAAEFGHITLDMEGRQCGCGSRGCFEQYASASGIARIAKEQIKYYPYTSLTEETVDSHSLYEAAIKGDSFGRDIMELCGYYLGVGVTSLLNTFNPEAVIFGGGLSKALELLLPVIKKTVADRGYSGIFENVNYHTVAHESEGPALGAIKYALDQE